MAPDLVIFDCDGVLVDTEPTSNRILCALLCEHGDAIDIPTTIEVFKGRSMASCTTLITERLGRMPADFWEQYVARTNRAFEEHVAPIPHVVTALDAIPAATCVASSGRYAKMQITLGQIGLWDRFLGRIYCAADVARGKPAPDLFQYAARQMGIAADRAVVIEDSLPGVVAARAAGMIAFGYAPPGTPATAQTALADAGAALFSDMRELPGLLGF